MKYNIILLSLLLTGLLVSCNEEEVNRNTDYVEPGYGKLTLTMDLPLNTGTKAEGDVLTDVSFPSEKEISSVAFFVHTEADEQGAGTFGKYFSTEEVGAAEGLNEPLIAIPDQAGKYKASIRHRSDGWKNPEVVVIANYEANELTDVLKAVTTWEELQQVTTLAGQNKNATAPLLMYAGQVIKSWESTAMMSGGGSVIETFTMERLVSRIDIRNYAYDPDNAEKNFDLKSARLVRPRIGVSLVPDQKETVIMSTDIFPFGSKVELVEEEGYATYQKIDSIYTYENANDDPATATAIQIEGTLGGVTITKLVDFKKIDVAGTPIPLARNHRYQININPAPDRVDVNFDVVVADWNEGEEIRVKPSFPKAEFNITSEETALTKAGMVWNGTKNIIDITNATEEATFTFTTTGNTETEPEVKFLYDKSGLSVGGIDKPTINRVPAIADDKPIVTTSYTVTIPYQATTKVPVDIVLNIHNSNNKSVGDTIIIRSLPNYEGTTAKPVLMKDGRYWAPVNVGATSIPTSVPTTGNITGTCGNLFQWGRKDGVPNTANADEMTNSTYSGNSYPTKNDLDNFDTWKNKCIIPKSTSPNMQNNWLLIKGTNIDNPSGSEMNNPEYKWANQLWNTGTENAPAKTKYDPCPKGWRVPTFNEWKAIMGNGQSGNNFLKMQGKNTNEWLILPLAARRGISKEGKPTQEYQGQEGFYYSSTPKSGSIHVWGVDVKSTSMTDRYDNRVNGFSIRCIQNDGAEPE